MLVQRVWRVRLGGKHRRIILYHNPADGHGAIYVDDTARQVFGPRVAPTSSTFTFEIDTFDAYSRICTVRIELTKSDTYRYECEIDGTRLVAEHDRSAPAATLLRSSVAPIRANSELLRAVGPGKSSETDELLRPTSDCPARETP